MALLLFLIIWNDINIMSVWPCGTTKKTNEHITVNPRSKNVGKLSAIPHEGIKTLRKHIQLLRSINLEKHLFITLVRNEFSRYHQLEELQLQNN